MSCVIRSPSCSQIRMSRASSLRSGKSLQHLVEQLGGAQDVAAGLLEQVEELAVAGGEDAGQAHRAGTVASRTTSKRARSMRRAGSSPTRARTARAAACRRTRRDAARRGRRRGQAHRRHGGHRPAASPRCPGSRARSRRRPGAGTGDACGRRRPGAPPRPSGAPRRSPAARVEAAHVGQRRGVAVERVVAAVDSGSAASSRDSSSPSSSRSARSASSPPPARPARRPSSGRRCRGSTRRPAA